MKQKNKKFIIIQKFIEFGVPSIFAAMALIFGGDAYTSRKKANSGIINVQRDLKEIKEDLQEIKQDIRTQNLKVYDNSMSINTLEVKVDEIKEDL